MTNHWDIQREFVRASEMAASEGFYLVCSRNNSGVDLLAKAGSGVWSDDVVLAHLRDFREVCVYMNGYHNAKLHSSMQKMR